MKQALLILENGQVYRGRGFGASGANYGELVFNTSMTGYPESITDPSYAGQILTFSYPLIGNYGVSSAWGESDKAHVVGVVVSELCQEPWHREGIEGEVGVRHLSFRGEAEKSELRRRSVNSEGNVIPSLTGDPELGQGATPRSDRMPVKNDLQTNVILSEAKDLSSEAIQSTKDSSATPRSDKEFHGRLEDFLAKFGKGGIEGVDTRELVKIIRQAGTMPAVLVVGEEGEQLNAGITYAAALEKVQNQDEIGFLDWPRKVARKEVEVYELEEGNAIPSLTGDPELGQGATPRSDGFPHLHNGIPDQVGNDNELTIIVVIDCGVKENILREVAKRGFKVVVTPPDIQFEELMKYDPKGVIVSNGPGDPRDYPYVHELLKRILDYSLNDGYLPVFGICLGHQLIAHVIGSEVFKMKFGNRGVNQPVQNTLTKQAFLTSQNHSYAVKADTIPQGWEPLFINLNDHTVEGLRHQTKPVFSVQFHPEACGGPRDTNWLFEEFVKLVNSEK